MRKTPFYISLAASLCAILLSCNNNPEAKQETTATDSMIPTGITQSAPQAADFKPFDVMVRTFDVKDFNRWKKIYDERVTKRDSAGLTQIGVARDMDDSSHVLTVFKLADVAKAKSFISSADMKQALKNGGVTDKAVSGFYHVVRRETSPSERQWVEIDHHVKDYDTWLKAFDAERRKRLENGMIDAVVARGIDDPKIVHLVLDFKESDRAKVKARLASEELKKIMKDAGVEGKPNVHLFKQVD